jgi:hypothetical protein
VRAGLDFPRSGSHPDGGHRGQLNRNGTGNAEAGQEVLAYVREWATGDSDSGRANLTQLGYAIGFEIAHVGLTGDDDAPLIGGHQPGRAVGRSKYSLDEGVDRLLYGLRDSEEGSS